VKSAYSVVKHSFDAVVGITTGLFTSSRLMFRLELPGLLCGVVRLMKKVRQVEVMELALLYFLQGTAGAIWMVPLSNVLDAHGLHQIRSFAFATIALAAFFSPLFFGSMADRHLSPVRVLRWLAVATTVAIVLVSASIQCHANRWLVLAFIQLYALCYTPISSISATVIFERLSNARQQFGRIRSMFTLGWLAGCMLVSVLNMDASVLACYAGAAVWLSVALATLFLPAIPAPVSAMHLSWRERLGLDALGLLKNRDHRVVFLTTMLLCIPLAAFYPHTPAHLRQIGFQRTSAWMGLGQVSEMVAMFSVGWLLLRWRLKWIFLAGLGFSVLRFVFCALNSKAWLLAGVALHGLSYTLIFVTAQIYLDQRVDPSWRARAQALMSLLNSGIGNLTGYLVSGFWLDCCTSPAGTRWPLFWSGMAVMSGAVAIYFVTAYQGRKLGLERPATERGV